VDDVVSAMIGMIPLLESSSTASYDVFNVATDDYISVRQIAEKVSEMIAPNATLRFGNQPRGWKGDVPIVRFNTSKIKSLGWKAHQTSEEAIDESLLAMANELNLFKGKPD
jgi:UDP-glucose 4-epimerase